MADKLPPPFRHARPVPLIRLQPALRATRTPRVGRCPRRPRAIFLSPGAKPCSSDSQQAEHGTLSPEPPLFQFFVESPYPEVLKKLLADGAIQRARLMCGVGASTVGAAAAAGGAHSTVLIPQPL